MSSIPEIIDSALEIACQIQQIPGPTFHEDRRADFVASKFQANGLDEILRDAAGNLLGRLRGAHVDSRPLILTAHMDSVFPEAFPLTLQREKGRICGPGIGDNCLGLAGLISLPVYLNCLNIIPEGDVWLIATTGEEGLGNLRGIRAVVERFGSTPLGYCSIEGMGLGNILHRALGVERYRVLARTRGGHSWVDFGTPSAIHELARLATRLSGLRLPAKPRSTINIGRFEGGTSVNTIADQAWMEVDLRSETAPGLAEISGAFNQIVTNSRKPNVEILVDRIGVRPPGELPRNHHFVRLSAQAISAQNLLPRYEIASTEANYPLSQGYPALTLGLTIGDRAHSAQEYIETAPVQKGMSQLTYIIQNAWA
jgi:tripeptide aminopeptidase